MSHQDTNRTPPVSKEYCENYNKVDFSSELELVDGIWRECNGKNNEEAQPVIKKDN